MESMEWIQPIVSAMLGGGLVLLAEHLRRHFKARGKKADAVVSLYSEFVVSFQLALHYNETHWAGVRSQISGAASYRETATARERRDQAEAAFRAAAWRLRLRERDCKQQAGIEALARSFDGLFDDLDDWQVAALEFETTAGKLRAGLHDVLARMQLLHGKTVGLF